MSRSGAGARPANRDAVVLGVNVDLIARQARKLRGEHELVRGFVEIDRRSPARSVGADKLTELFVERQQIAQRIPPREGHVRIVEIAGDHMCYDLKDIQVTNGLFCPGNTTP